MLASPSPVNSCVAASSYLFLYASALAIEIDSRTSIAQTSSASPTFAPALDIGNHHEAVSCGRPLGTLPTTRTHLGLNSFEPEGQLRCRPAVTAIEMPVTVRGPSAFRNTSLRDLLPASFITSSSASHDTAMTKSRHLKTASHSFEKRLRSWLIMRSSAWPRGKGMYCGTCFFFVSSFFPFWFWVWVWFLVQKRDRKRV